MLPHETPTQADKYDKIINAFTLLPSYPMVIL
jgi:hypothetical protein